MIKKLVHGPIFLAGESEVATKEDLQIVQDLLDTPVGWPLHTSVENILPAKRTTRCLSPKWRDLLGAVR